MMHREVIPKFEPGRGIHGAVSVATGATALPTIDGTLKPKLVAVIHDGGGAAGVIMDINFGNSTVASPATNGFSVPAHELCIFDVAGYDFYNAAGRGGTCNMTIYPLANY